MTSSQKHLFIKYILQSVVDDSVLKLVDKHLKNFQQWAQHTNIFNTGDQMNLTHAQQMKLQAERYTKGIQKLKNMDKENFHQLFANADIFFETGGFFLNPSAFMKTIQMLGDDQQVKYWVDRTLSGKIVGAYAQTQLGHGSNVQGLQTQARYNSVSKTWTFNSPKASSAKFWPGLLGIYCTSVVLQAKAYVNDKSIGVQTFAIDIRDSNLNSFQGIDVGQMGSKLGMAHLDHGFMRFKDFKLPRRAMLMRYVRVLQDGTVQGLENKQALKYGYGSMLNLRVFLTTTFGAAAFKSVRCAANYFKAANRLQDPDVRSLLLNGYSVSLGIIIANRQPGKLFKMFTKHMQLREYSQADKLLMDCHIISSTLKAVTSWKSMAIIKKLLTFDSNLTLKNTFVPKAFCDQTPSVTYEGDNSVLLQLTAKHLLKNNEPEPSKPSSLDPECFDSLEAAFKYCFYKQLQRNKSLMGKDMEKGLQLLQIWNETMQRQLIELSKLWGRYILVKFYNTSHKQYQGPSKQTHKKIGLTFIHSLVDDSKDRFPFYGLDVPHLDCVGKFSNQEYEMLRESSHWKQLPEYKASSRFLEQKGKEYEKIVMYARL